MGCQIGGPMFARIKKTGKYPYLQIVENRKEKGKVRQRVISTIAVWTSCTTRAGSRR
jgi:hypothetical protein